MLPTLCSVNHRGAQLILSMCSSAHRAQCATFQAAFEDKFALASEYVVHAVALNIFHGSRVCSQRE
jgi:hypothetical protein